MKKASMILTVALIAADIFLCLGVTYIFPACGMKDDGTYMRCHWAQQAVMTAAGAAAIAHIAAFFMKDMKIRAGAVLASIPITLSAVLLASNHIIPICMVDNMLCWTRMRPAVIGIGILTIVIEAVAVWIALKGTKNNENH